MDVVREMGDSKIRNETQNVYANAIKTVWMETWKH